MTTVFLVGSRKFSEEINKIEDELKKKRINVLKGRDENGLIKEMFERIDSSDIVYVFAKEGYIGLTVALEIGYAHAKKKKIISSEPLAENEMNFLICEVLSPKEFIECFSA